MKNCGRRFHNEVGKYRFLNELIKVVSPKVSSLQIRLQFTQMKSMLSSIQPRFNHLLFLVHGWQCTGEGEAEDCRDAVQLDSGFSKWSQDRWSLPDAEKTGCVEMINIIACEKTSVSKEAFSSSPHALHQGSWHVTRSYRWTGLWFLLLRHDLNIRCLTTRTWARWKQNLFCIAVFQTGCLNGK